MGIHYIDYGEKPGDGNLKIYRDEELRVEVTNAGDVIVHTGNVTIEKDAVIKENLSVLQDVAIKLKFGCNGAYPQSSASVGLPAYDIGTCITLVNNIREALIDNGICTT
jgi:hypothetical protein